MKCNHIRVGALDATDALEIDCVFAYVLVEI